MSRYKFFVFMALALVVAPARAQSAVTVYGLVDIGFEQTRGTDGAGHHRKSLGINSGPLGSSHIGVRGEEALPGDLTATFALEYALAADNNSGLNEAREQALGLSGNFGSLKAGLVYPPGYDYASKYDVTGAANAFSIVQAFAQNNSFTQALSVLAGAARANTVRYDAPTVAGISVSAAYGFAGDAVSGNSDARPFARKPERFAAIALDFDNETLSVGFFAAQTRDIDTAGGRASEFGLAAAYAWDAVQLIARIDRFVQRFAGKSDDIDKQLVSAGVAVPLGDQRLSVNVARLHDAHRSHGDSSGYGVLFEHPLSKRSVLYAGFAHSRNQRNASAAIPTGGGSSVSGPFDGVLGDGQRSTGYAVGLAHSF